MKLVKILLTIAIILGFSNLSPASNPADIIVENAELYLDTPYVSGQPPNKEVEWGAIFDLESWTPINGFDCSGLVSLAGGLRRHYSVQYRELSYFVSLIKWEDLQHGDIIMNDDHVIIFDRREGMYLKTIETGVTHGVEVGSYIDPAQNSSKDIYLRLYGFQPYRFKTDNTNPTITISGVEDGGVYNYAVTVGISADDDTFEPTPGLYFYGQDSGGKFRQKQFTEEGTYYDYFI